MAPCFEYCATMTVFTVDRGELVDQTDFPMHSHVAYDRVRLLRDQKVDVVICGGVQDFYEDLLRANGIQLISWVSGNVVELLNLFLQGQLAPGE